MAYNCRILSGVALKQLRKEKEKIALKFCVDFELEMQIYWIVSWQIQLQWVRNKRPNQLEYALAFLLFRWNELNCQL